MIWKLIWERIYLVLLIVVSIILFIITLGNFRLPRIIRQKQKEIENQDEEIADKKVDLETEREETDKIGGDPNQTDDVIERADDFIDKLRELLSRDEE